MELHLFGIPVTIRQDFWFIAGIYALFGLQSQTPIEYILVSIFCLFLAVLWHEAGHALSASGYKLGPVAITIHGLGGHTTHRPSPVWWKNLLVTLAGPGSGLLLAALAFGGMVAWPHGLVGHAFLQLFVINLFLSVLNMMPVYPMDGGQALRTTLGGMRVRNADLWTANVGIVGALLLVLFAAWSIFTGHGLIILLFISLQMLYQNWQLRASTLPPSR